MAEALVRAERRGPAAVLTLDSPANRNALSAALLEQLHAALREAMDDPATRAVVLTGAGPVFCSGADLKEQRTGVRPVVNLPEILTLILEGSKPVVARVNGAARAGGLGLIAACDLTVGLTTATFGFSEVRIGVAPAIIAVPVLRRMDPRAARELFLTGEPFDGERAREAGLLDRAVPEDRLDATVDELVAQLALGAPEAVAATKQLLRDLPGPDLAADFGRMAALSAERFGSDEAREGIAALLEKRRPAWAQPD
ncbi:enoyl-CoA hydratase-related protein [Blastococcus sp. LR1]|uniref:enoyl-CoA hydratase-related protein n=1 Tax=Blastococcus sp. LR1 TaxID=2877000 RepID=UPI001CCA941B|nr:enoyl-CoA hydratase-related protein [Blastococcus sp. LR1]MCA0144149.1 enoyl-CoA hydratase/isomerase family protein [Blastococcus sp. LR1]